MDKQLFELTNPQKSIWYTEQFYNNTPVNNICGYVFFKDKINSELLQKAIQIYISQNNAFHLNLKMNDKTVVQYLNNYSLIKVPLNYINSEEDFQNLGKRIASTPFNILNSILVTAEIFLFPDSTGGFFFNSHHIVSDAITLGITAKTVSNIYYSLINSEEVPNQPTSYIDFITKENEYMQSSRFEKDKAFWEDIYSTIPDIATIPYSHANSIETNCLGKRKSFSFDIQEIASIKNYCAEHKTSLFAFFMSVYSLYISKVSGISDFTIGTPILNRNTFIEKNTPGMFISTVPFRVTVPENTTFAEFLNTYSKNSMMYLKHQKYPYQKLLESIREKTSNISNLYNILISYQVTKTLNEKINYSTGWIFNGNVADDIQIHLTDFNETGKIDVSYDYKTCKYSDSTIEELHKKVSFMISQIVNNPEINLNNIELVLPEEKNEILSYSTSKYFYEKSIILEIEKIAKENPEKIAIETKNSSISYAELLNRVNKLANKLITTHNIKPNSFIGILPSHSIDSIIGILSISKINCTFVPIDPEYPEERIIHMINSSGITNILFDESSLESNNLFKKLNLINIEYSKYENESSLFENSFNYDENSNLYVVFTSGSTGKPKGITLSHKNMLNLIFFEKNDTDLFKNNLENRILQFATMSFDVSYQEIFSSLLTASTLILVDSVTRKNSDLLCDYIKNKQINILFIPPAYLRLLTKSEENLSKLENLEKIITAGEALIITEGIKYLINQNVVLYNHYGPAETHVCTTYKIDKNNLFENKPPIGTPITNSNVFILDNSNNLLPNNVIGQIAITGNCVGNGYLNNESLTNENFVTLPLSTSKVYLSGDLGYRDYNGIIHLSGRKDFQVKLNGFRIELGEIDSVISSYTGISHSISVIQEQNNKKHIVSFYTTDKNISENKLEEYVYKKLPTYMHPTKIIKLDKFLINANGKIDRKSLPLIDFTIQNQKIEEPTTDTEKTLVQLWKEIFESDSIGILSNFFELGGDSLSAIELVARISSCLNVTISISDIYNLKNIKNLANHIDKLPQKSSEITINKVTHSNYYTASSAQKRIYLATKANENSTVYNMPGAILFDGNLDYNKVVFAFNQLINIHSSFRTSFELEHETNEIVQKINKNIEFYIQKYNSEYKNIDTIIKNFVTPFKLDLAPLLHVELHYFENNKSLLLFDSHHIILDGISLNIFIKDFCMLYNEKSVNIPEFEYIDFSNWEQNYLSSESYSKNKEFWNFKLNKKLPYLNFPYDYPASYKKTWNGNKISETISDDILNKISDLAKEKNISTFSIFLASFYVLLSRYCNQEEITIGVPTSGRYFEELNNIIGMFVNNLILNTNVDSHLYFDEFCNQINALITEAISHEPFVFENIESTSSALDVMFTFQNMKPEKISCNSLNAKMLDIKTNTSKFNLSMELNPYTKIINLEYCTDLIKDSSAQEFLYHYLEVLRFITNNFAVKVKNISILSEQETTKILNTFNNYTLDIPENESLVTLFDKIVKKYPNNIAVSIGKYSITYKELDEKSNSLAATLMQYNLKPGDVVGVCLNKSIEFIISIWAILKTGAIYMPMYIGYPEERLNYMLTNSNAKLLITNAVMNNFITTKTTRIILENYFNIYNLQKLKKNKLPKPNDIAYIIYTSGSTGKPKGVKITHKNLINYVYSFNKFYENITNKDVFLSSTNVSFDVSIWEIFMPLLNGAKLVLYKEEFINNIIKYCYTIVDSEITALYIPPNILNEVYDILKNESNLKLNKILVGVEPIRKSTLNKYFELNPNMKIINGYGPTETTICATALDYKKDDSDDSIVSIGRPLHNNKIYILNKHKKLQPINVIGELYIGGNGVGTGYLNNETETNKAFIKNPYEENSIFYKTGDLAKWNDDGTISFIGRTDSQIKISGYRIELKEINHIIMQFPNIIKAYTTTHNNVDNTVIVAYFTAEKNISISDLTSYLQSKLPFYMIPGLFMQLDNFPLTVNGKIDKKSLPTPNIRRFHKYVAPRNNFEKKLAKIWQDLLHVDKISINDNFFDLGGDSLLAIKFQVEALNFGLNLSYNDIFSYPTIKKLSEKNNEAFTYTIDKNYDYSKINELLAKNTPENIVPSQKINLENILLIGATGYLGAHILDNFLTNHTGIAYCLVRQKSLLNPENRLKQILNFYFGNKYDNEFGKRIIVICGDIIDKNFNLIYSDYETLANNISVVINSGALVKHYGDFTTFNNINVNGTKNIVDFCKNFNKKLYHISTISVSGMGIPENSIVKGKERFIFNETHLNVNQNLDNVYLYTKFEAEKLIYEEILNGLNACVLRIGNLSNRASDGKFQINISENAFLNKFKSILNLGVIQKSFLSHSLEITPVDACADCIIKIIENNPKFSTLHLYNTKLISFKNLLTYLDALGYVVYPVTNKEFSATIARFLRDKILKNKISGIVTDLNKNKVLDIISNVLVDASFSSKYLDSIGFKWPSIDFKYIKQFVDYFNEIGYF